MSELLDAFWQASARLDRFIETAPPQTDTSRKAIRARAEVRMGRLRRFLAQLGDPLQGIPIVHVGGTSGKGSTSTTIAAILTAAGYRTGLHTSPYLQVPSEKLQVDGQLIAPDTFVRLTDTVVAAHDAWQAAGNEQLTYGEMWIALMALYFRDEQVDFAVVEVGAGGRFDLTNIVSPVLSVVTSVGIDHTNTLGPTIEDIAWHKAGIIKPGVPAISAVQHPAAQPIMAAEAREVGAPLAQLDHARQVQEVTVTGSRTTWFDTGADRRWTIGLAGAFQAVNGSTAVAAARALAQSGYRIDEGHIEAGLLHATIPGRAEHVPDRVPILLDGAHNEDKIAALVADLDGLLPIGPAGRRIAVVGALESKQAGSMMRSLAPHVHGIVATSPKVLAKASRDAEELANTARAAGITGDIVAEPDPKQAVARALAMAGPGDAVLVTGSLYLVGNVRERWYASDAIVLQRTSWPAVQVAS